MADSPHPRPDECLASLLARAATIDELLSDEYEALPGQKGDTDLAARRLAAWCRASASGDWSLFERRLQRDALSISQVLARFATARRRASLPPQWVADAAWILEALTRVTVSTRRDDSVPLAFEDLLAPLADEAEARLWPMVGAGADSHLDPSGRTTLRQTLVRQLSELCAPALYQRLVETRKTTAMRTIPAGLSGSGASSFYARFVADMRKMGFRELFTSKPVLLRLMATITRQWIDTSCEFLTRLHADRSLLLQQVLDGDPGPVVAIEGDVSDRHNHGRTVLIVTFSNGARVVYKPKDLRLDAAWQRMVERLQGTGDPATLRAVRTVACEGYGWTEFIEHAGCRNAEDCKRFFRRAGAWLALFHCFCATDMHQENMIAAGDHPVPIDLEMLLQAVAEENRADGVEAHAFEAAMDIVASSVLVVGLLPAYAKTPDEGIAAIGGMASDWTSGTRLTWDDINSDAMHPRKISERRKSTPNLPHVAGIYARFGDHLDDFVSGFDDYAKFLLSVRNRDGTKRLFEGFTGMPVRKIVRPTRFYAMLLQRLRDHRTMHDGVIWSAQADFIARLSDWERDGDRFWPLQRAERAALTALNVPHFVAASDGNDIHDAAGASVRALTASGFARAQARLAACDEQEIAWQIELIRQNTGLVSSSAEPTAGSRETQRQLTTTPALTRAEMETQVDAIAEQLARHAIRRGSGAAWIALDWLGDTEVSQLVALGPQLYNGNCGIAVCLAAHAAVRKAAESKELAYAAILNTRSSLRSRNAARTARSLGIGGGTGLGSVVYSLTILSKLLLDERLLEDAHLAASLFSADLIASDRHLDVMGGSAGAILGLLKLYRESRSDDVLQRAIDCGRHLLGQPRQGPYGRRMWSAAGVRPRPLNGLSHGAAGFAYALALLASASGQEEFAHAASECIAFENATYDGQRGNWPDLRGGDRPFWPCQWCYGATGIGLARIATMRGGTLDAAQIKTDIVNALAGAERSWPGSVDTLCCGTLGSIEFFCEAAEELGRNELHQQALQRLGAVLATASAAGDFRWNTGTSRFNLGLFRGLAGTGYTILRRIDRSLPNVLIWE